MRRWTRRERTGCWGAVVGAVVCLIFLNAAPSVREWLWGSSPLPAAPTEQVDLVPYQDAFEQQRKLLEEQSLAIKEEVRRLHDERISGRKERIRSLATRYEEGDERKYDKILFENLCKIPIHVAIHYKDLDDTWVTRGWWNVKPGATVATDAFTRNTPIYLYAENTTAGRTWDGTGRPQSVSFTISNSRFDHLKGDRFVHDDPREVSFYRRETGKAWTDHKETFECYVEAPP